MRQRQPAQQAGQFPGRRPVRITGPVHQDEYGHSGPSRNLHANLFASFLY